GPDHQKHFRATARVAGRSWGDGEGNSKKEAEQRAAEAAWGAIRAEANARVAESADAPSDPEDMSDETIVRVD
ncbi:MAG: ribonuclease, partial [Frankiales bacterium]|nr:ribonuclease [Frankiales bacterium]